MRPRDVMLPAVLSLGLANATGCEKHCEPFVYEVRKELEVVGGLLSLTPKPDCDGAVNNLMRANELAHGKKADACASEETVALARRRIAVLTKLAIASGCITEEVPAKNPPGSE